MRQHNGWPHNVQESPQRLPTSRLSEQAWGLRLLKQGIWLQASDRAWSLQRLRNRPHVLVVGANVMVQPPKERRRTHTHTHAHNDDTHTRTCDVGWPLASSCSSAGCRAAACSTPNGAARAACLSSSGCRRSSSARSAPARPTTRCEWGWAAVGHGLAQPATFPLLLLLQQHISPPRPVLQHA
jgi:hypothetical protein